MENLQCSQLWKVHSAMHMYIITYFIIFSVDESHFELVLCGINSEQSGLAVSIQTVNTAALHHGDVDRDIQGADYTMITNRNKRDLNRAMSLIRYRIISCTNTFLGHFRMSRHLPIGQSIFDVVTGGVDEHTVLIPPCTL